MATNRRIQLFILFTVLVLLSSFIYGGETRKYLATGGWYPSSSSHLIAQIDNYLAQANLRKLPGPVAALIGPHAGLKHSGPCAASAYKQLSQTSPKRIILLGVAHGGGFYGACVSTYDSNSTPLGKIPVDTAITSQLGKEKFFIVNNRIMQYEHSIENHLPFLQRALKNKKYKIIPILFGMLNKRDFNHVAQSIKKHINAHTIVIASTDLTHYGTNFAFTPFKENIKTNLTKLDMGIIHPILNFDFPKYYDYKMRTGITMCGFTPVGILIHLFNSKAHTGTLMKYATSGDASSNYKLSVSYASIIISRISTAKEVNMPPGHLSEQERHSLLTLARSSLNGYFDNSEIKLNESQEDKLTPHLKNKTGVFVTLKKKGQLRGCIGSIIGLLPLHLGVKENALKAAVKDPRFAALTKEELKDINIEISVMTPLQKLDNYKQIRLGIDGVIIKRGYRQAVFLPQVARETNWDLHTFLTQLCRKAGLQGDSYKKAGMSIYIFQAQVFCEKGHKN